VRGSRGILKTLLEHGATVDLQDDEGKTGLHDAIINGYFPLVKILVDHGANVDIIDKNGRNALHYASLCSMY
jgi:ankyrin repeat protein